ncbi:MAG: glycosyltransferase [Vitreimonas sp.]
MRVLITNLYLSNFSGSENVVELLADGLRRAGHEPVVLAPNLGPQATRMQASGHIVVDRVAAVPARPDVLHLQHTPVALAVLAAFPDTPAVFSCHSALFEVEAPRPHPQIREWIAVDDLCRQRCLSRGAPNDRLTTILNAVDLERFALRSALPSRPRRALLMAKNFGHHDVVRTACSEAGIDLDELGRASDRFSDRIELELPKYDLVFGTARMALEAAAVGCAVLVGDARGFAGLLTSDVLESWRSLNFGAGLLSRPMTLENVREAIARYDVGDANRVTSYLRSHASLDQCVANHLAVYQKAIAGPSSATTSECAIATATWAEDLAATGSDRAWRTIARELFGMEAGPASEQIALMEQKVSRQLSALAQAAEERLASLSQAADERAAAFSAAMDERLISLSAATEEQLTSLSRATDERLTSLSRATDERLSALFQASRAHTARLAAAIEDLSARTANEAAQRLEAERASQQSPSPLAKVWRAAVPHAVRAPLFRLRQRLMRRT